jgi:hypothetical protein
MQNPQKNTPKSHFTCIFFSFCVLSYRQEGKPMIKEGRIMGKRSVFIKKFEGDLKSMMRS